MAKPMRKETTEIFGSPIPPSLVSLACEVDRAIDRAVNSCKDIAERNDQIKQLRKELDEETERRLDAEHVHPRNLGGHYYPGCADTARVFTSDCDYCDCVMGPSRSRSPEGVDPFRECPGNPKIATAYEMLKGKLDVAVGVGRTHNGIHST